MSDADVTRLLARRDLQDVHRLALRVHADLKRISASPDLLSEVGYACHHIGNALRILAARARACADSERLSVGRTV